jgi:hypothetical protein
LPKTGFNKEEQTPLQWWVQHKLRFPRLYRMAIDFLAIPTTSAECERVFSLCRLALGSQQQRMKVQTLEQIVLMKK